MLEEQHNVAGHRADWFTLQQADIPGVWHVYWTIYITVIVSLQVGLHCNKLTFLESVKFTGLFILIVSFLIHPSVTLIIMIFLVFGQTCWSKHCKSR